MIFTAMAWAPTFGVIAGVNAIPADIKEASRAYGVRGFKYLRQIVLPAVYPELIWSSILAWGGGWYLIPIEEYIPGTVNLPGLGSYIAIAGRKPDLASALFGLIILVGIIFAIDQLVWRPLGRRAEKYKYETVAAPATETQRSIVGEGMRRYEGRLISPVTSFLKSEKSYFNRVIEITRLRRLLHARERLRFPEPITRFPASGKPASYAIFPIGQSIPATALFPLVIILLVDPFRNTPYLGLTLNIASIVLILTGMQWYLLFNIVGAVNSVPNDLLEASHAYGVRGGRFVKEILVPASFPAILIGSIQAWGGGWNALIVSEYVSADANVQGLGSFLVKATTLEADPAKVALANVEIFAALLVMTATVLIINRLVWRRMLRKADKYKFEA